MSGFKKVGGHADVGGADDGRLEIFQPVIHDGKPVHRVKIIVLIDPFQEFIIEVQDLDFDVAAAERLGQALQAVRRIGVKPLVLGDLPIKSVQLQLQGLDQEDFVIGEILPA